MIVRLNNLSTSRQFGSTIFVERFTYALPELAIDADTLPQQVRNKCFSAPSDSYRVRRLAFAVASSRAV